MAEEGRRASLDHLDWDKDKGLSKDSPEIDLGANSATGAIRQRSGTSLRGVLYQSCPQGQAKSGNKDKNLHQKGGKGGCLRDKR